MRADGDRRRVAWNADAVIPPHAKLAKGVEFVMKSFLAVASMRRMLLLAGFAVGIVSMLTTGGAMATGATVKPAASVVISTRTLPTLGTVLVNSKGHTLYMFVPDKQKKVTCVGSCAAVWPPVKLLAGAKAAAEGHAKSSLLGSDPDPAGGRVVTYNKWPLYTWVGDAAPGKDTGQALNINGGLWYVLSPAGKVITTKLVTKPTTTTTTKTTTTPTTTTPATTTTATIAPPATTTTATIAPPPATTTTAAGAVPYPDNTDPACAPGTTINTQGSTDADGDETGQMQSDGDGCI